MSTLRNGVAVLTLALGAGICTPFVAAAHAQATATGKPMRVRTKLDGFDIEPKSGKAQNQIGGASRGLGLSLYAPKLAKAYTLTPTFLWNAEDASAEYIFRLSVLSTGQGQLFESKVSGGSFTYPNDAPPLMPGSTYVWQVTPANDLLGGPASASVLIVGGAERSKIESALHGSGASAANARVFMDNRLWYDAQATYTSLIASEPKNAEFYKGRAELYDQIPQTHDLADMDLSKAQH